MQKITISYSKNPLVPYGDVYVIPQPKYNDIIVSVYDNAIYSNCIEVENLVLSIVSEHRDTIINLPIKCLVVTPEGVGAVLHCGYDCAKKARSFLGMPKFKRFQVWCDLIYRRYDKTKNYVSLLQTYEELQETLATIREDLEDLIELLTQLANEYDLPPNPFDDWQIGRCADYPVFYSED